MPTFPGIDTIAKYGRDVVSSFRLIFENRMLFCTALLYATAAVPLTWDQGSSSTVPSLPGFESHFGISSGSNANAIRNFISLVFLGDAAGAAVSFLINDRIGRLWSLRLYAGVWTVGQLTAIFAPGIAGLYASRIVSGLGIGGLTVTGPMSLAEIAPKEVRGLMTAWFTVMMGMAHMCASFCVYGVFLHVPPSRLQYQVVWFAPCIYLFLWVLASFFLCESPYWLFLANRRDDAIQTLVRLRGLPANHPRLQAEIGAVEGSIQEATASIGNHEGLPSVISTIKATFATRSNLRRVQQVLILYALPQLSGANTITSYFVPVLKIIGSDNSTEQGIFLSSMYTMARFFYAVIASFFFIDALGRRKSLFTGITLQMIGDIYLSVYVKVQQDSGTSKAASEAALAMIFIHSFGYSVGLLTLPYVFGGELWPNNIRSFGGALSQTFHWLFSYAMTFALPSLLDSTHNWGAFVFFGTWCALSLLYVYLLVPEIAGLSTVEMEEVFRRPWFSARNHLQPFDSPKINEDEDLNTKQNATKSITEHRND